jgi:hypothetical protein
MTDFDDFERRLAASIRSDADASVGPFTPESIARAAIADTGSGATRARRSSRPAGRSGRGRGMTLLAAAAFLLVGGALVGSSLLRPPSIVPPDPAPSFAVVTTPLPDETATPTPSAFVTPSPPPSLDLTWTEVPIGEQFATWNGESFSPRLAWIGDRFVLADVTSGAVMSSTDGQDWQVLPADGSAQTYVDLLRGSLATWQDSAVGWWNPQDNDGPETAGGPPLTAKDVVQIVHPTAAPPSTSPFKGRIESIGFGPRGFVARVHSHLDLDAWITKKLGLRTNNDWTCCVKSLTFKDGVLELKLSNRRGLRVVWADQGFAPGDFQDGGFVWYSPDGEHWTVTAPNDADYPSPGDPPSNLPFSEFGHVVGIADGFIATGSSPEGSCADPDGSCTGMWFSSDGLTWRHLGTTTRIRESGRELCIRDGCSSLPGELVPWQGGALAIDGDGRTESWTSGGPTKLPIVVHGGGTVATGPLGIVSIGDGQVLVSRDGIAATVSSIPTQMVGDPRIAIGDRTVVVLESARVDEFRRTYSLWLGKLEP